MSEADRLRETINDAIPMEGQEWPGDDAVVAAIAASICDELRITRERADQLYTLAERAAAEYGDHAPHYTPWGVAAALTALLDVAGR